MKKYLLLPLILITLTSVQAQDALEEAIVLNQELQFLEDSARGIKSTALEVTANSRKRKVIEESLEKTYFEDEQTDSISTRTSSRRRRSN
jgi:hypothetical protein